jgi:tetratricopeptide (TPR) repeat protein
MPDGTTRTLWQYAFVSDLHWVALERYGFADEQRPGKGSSEKLEMSAALANALTEVYAPEERLVATPLARLLRDVGHQEVANHYQRMAEYAADSAMMREQAIYLLAFNKEHWEQWECERSARFLIEAGKKMSNVYPFDETLMVFEEAYKLARRANYKSGEAWAQYLCGSLLHAEGDNKAARESANISLNIFRHLREKRGVAPALHLLATIEYVEGRYAEAWVTAAEGLQLAQESSNRLATAVLLSLQAEIDFSEDRHTVFIEPVSQNRRY